MGKGEGLGREEGRGVGEMGGERSGGERRGEGWGREEGRGVRERGGERWN